MNLLKCGIWCQSQEEELADKLKTKKTAISRIENHAEDIKISTLERVALALGKKIKIIIT